eukprot:2630388-Prorocentrum_lima.AAC.1
MEALGVDCEDGMIREPCPPGHGGSGRRHLIRHCDHVEASVRRGRSSSSTALDPAAVCRSFGLHRPAR